MKTVQVGNMAIAYRVRRLQASRRLSIHVTPGRVEVVVPDDTDEASVEAFVGRRRKWIFTQKYKLEEAATKLLQTKPSRFATGAKIPYRGRRMKLVICPSDETGIRVRYDNGFFVDVPQTRAVEDGEIEQAVAVWMKGQLKADCENHVRHYTDRLDVAPKGLRIKDQKHLWGSLGKDHIININWHLVFAPRLIAEYVVAHEMCHLKHKNHSPTFWRLLRSLFPQTDDCKNWLEKNTDVWEAGV